jgi:hypothetical protein
LFCVCSSDTAYLHNFMVYCGKGSKIGSPDVAEQPLTYRLVEELTRQYRSNGLDEASVPGTDGDKSVRDAIIYMDNYFTSGMCNFYHILQLLHMSHGQETSTKNSLLGLAVETAVKLYNDMGFRVVGVIRNTTTSSRKGKDDETFAFEPIPDAAQKDLHHGWWRQGYVPMTVPKGSKKKNTKVFLVCTQVKDNKIINLVSTACNGSPDDQTKMKRREKGKGGQQVEYDTTPEHMAYMQNMGGVDRFDRHQSDFNIVGKTGRWYIKVVGCRMYICIFADATCMLR